MLIRLIGSTVEIAARAAPMPADMVSDTVLRLAGEVLTNLSFSGRRDLADMALRDLGEIVDAVPDPRLWWPNGLGST